MVSIIKKNIKLIIFIILVGVLSFGSVYAATLFRASDIIYTPPSGNSENNVQTALDYLYSKAGNLSSSSPKDNNVYFEFINPEHNINISTTDYRNVGFPVFVAVNGMEKSVCYYFVDDYLTCFDAFNFEVESQHLFSLFPDVTFYDLRNNNNLVIDWDYDYCVLGSDYAECCIGANGDRSYYVEIDINLDGSVQIKANGINAKSSYCFVLEDHYSQCHDFLP